ncbi:hypothetical protein BDF14DRAFT_1854390, partial [Spinellus fusiger]
MMSRALLMALLIALLIIINIARLIDLYTQNRYYRTRPTATSCLLYQILRFNEQSLVFNLPNNSIIIFYNSILFDTHLSWVY